MQQITIKHIVVFRFVRTMTPEESAVAKSTGMQEEQDLSIQDASLFRVLSLKKKISKSEANYTERRD